MALKTLGTNANNSIQTAVMWLPGYNSGLSASDIASVANGILNDQVNSRPVVPGAFDGNGLLFIPNRGVLRILPGDYVGVDSTGWPILLSANAIANGPWTHS